MIVGRLKIGRYDIERHVASGGMAEVYQARDADTGRVVALKIPHDGEEIWEAERTGAMLQVELSKRDARVPRVYEIGDGEERFVAMEYVEGDDLSRLLKAGPLDWREATSIAVELCGVLATARSCGAPNGEAGGIVHGDIKPRNIRVQQGGHVKVLDFGIAKALRQTRAETRNLYGSVPYSSPERLDRGHVDYHSDLWSVAVVLYEMLQGRQPFRAASDVELERAIRSGARPAPLDHTIPRQFEAILHKAFARDLVDRYATARELEAELRAVLLDAEGHATRLSVTGPDAAGDDATRRTPAGNGDDATRRASARPPGDTDDVDATRRTPPFTNGASDLDATRRTVPATNGSDLDATRRTVASSAPTTRGATDAVSAPARTHASYAQASETSVLATATTPLERTAPRLDGRRLPWPRRLPWKVLGIAVLFFIGAREIRALGAARDLYSSLAARPRGEATAVWNQYQRVTSGHVLVNLTGLGGAVRDWMVSHADDLISRYRSDTPTLYETGWRSAETLLQHAGAIDPGNRRIQARLEFCRAHLLRIAARDAKQSGESMSRYDEAASRFERAARLWRGWGDPYIGLAQIDAYGKRDPERTAQDLERARDARYPFGERETALLGDAYRLRAERRWAASTDAFDVEQYARHLERTRGDCVKALEQYEQVPSYAGVPRHLRALRQRLAEIDVRLAWVSGISG